MIHVCLFMQDEGALDTLIFYILAQHKLSNWQFGLTIFIDSVCDYTYDKVKSGGQSTNTDAGII